MSKNEKRQSDSLHDSLVTADDAPVGVPRLVDVGHARHDLSEELPALHLAESVSVHYVVKQLPPWAVLQHLQQSPVRGEWRPH